MTALVRVPAGLMSLSLPSVSLVRALAPIAFVYKIPVREGQGLIVPPEYRQLSGMMQAGARLDAAVPHQFRTEFHICRPVVAVYSTARAIAQFMD